MQVDSWEWWVKFRGNTQKVHLFIWEISYSQKNKWEGKYIPNMKENVLIQFFIEHVICVPGLPW